MPPSTPSTQQSPSRFREFDDALIVILPGVPWMVPLLLRMKPQSKKTMVILRGIQRMMQLIIRSILERGELRTIEWNVGAVLPFVGFAVAMFLFYSLVLALLKVDLLYFIAFGSVSPTLVIPS
ncbi:hypothetical protein Droror1_Dr00024168 [Drosera rotundifolia]